MQEIYKGTKEKNSKILKDFLKENEAPPWRKSSQDNGKNYDPSEEEKVIVNVALYLRRPILLGGSPGIGKSSLAKSVAYELTERKLLHWQITTHSVLKDGLYEYDAVGRLQDAKDSGKNDPIGTFITLGALGSAFASDTMRVVLIDELDKSDIDFPNNLLHVLEEQEFAIPELARTGKSTHTIYNADGKEVTITLEDGKLKCKIFPLIIFTSNKEREFPPAFMRRVLSHDITLPEDEKELEDKLFKILENHLNSYETKDGVKDFQEIEEKVREIIRHFIKETKHEDKQLSTDQLMHAIFLKLQGIDIEKEDILKKIWHKLAD